MKISIHTTITKPDYWQYAWKESINSFLALADEVIVMYGDKGDEKLLSQIDVPMDKELKTEYMEWPYEFSWDEISKHNNRGYELCTGDWAIKCDVDYLFHEHDVRNIYSALQNFDVAQFMAASFMKFTVLNKERAYEKVHLPFIINKRRMGSKIQYGPSTTEKCAWGYPIIVEKVHKSGLPTGPSINMSQIPSVSSCVFNYDSIFKTKKIIKEQFYRFSRARYRSGFGYLWGDSEEESFKVFCGMMKNRISKTAHFAKDISNAHPVYIADKIKKLTEDQYGYNNWNNFKDV